MKKGLLKGLLALVLSGVAVLGLVACDGGSNPTSTPSVTPTPDVTPTPVDELAEQRKATLKTVKTLFDYVNRGKYSDSDLEALDALYETAKGLVEAATTSDQLDGIPSAVQESISKFENQERDLKKATGVYSFVASSYEVRTEILAVLEEYAYSHFLTGFSLIDDGGYQLFSTSVKRGVDTYVPGYGWATLSDGQIVSDLSGETKAEWKRYYHTFETSDPKSINYGDDKGSVVGDLVAYVAGSYWDTRLNETNDGYEWYSLLAKEKPVAVNANAKTGLATKYQWKLNTGADGFKYATLSSKFSAYDGREVAAEDYLTPFKMLFTKGFGWARSAESLTGAGSIKGVQAYYNASEDGFNADAWEKVGLSVTEVDGEYVMSVEFNVPCTPFYAMYYMNSQIYAPVPMDFINDLGKASNSNTTDAFKDGAALFGKSNIDLGLTPVDTFLSTGVYEIEAWAKDQEIVFKRNADFTLCGDRYKIAGIHVNILEAANNDPEAAWKEFNAGKLSSCGVPSTQKQDRTKNDSVGYAVYTPGSGNFKLNVNSCTQELWEQLFGEEGTITTTVKDKYWQCEPALSNSDFLLGLSWSINRQQLATNLGKGVSVAYFGDAYLSDPENGVVYNTTSAHLGAIKDLTLSGAYLDGYNLEIAKSYFAKACEKFIADGTYKAGDTISLEIAWQGQSQFATYGDPVIQMWKDAFNAVGAEYGLTLEGTNWASANWQDVYYKKMMVGQFDIGFGGISGNSLNPINFLEVLKSDNSSGFTLNWGADTSKVDIVYKGELWSFDALWKAADQGGYFVDGVEVNAFAPDFEGASLADFYTVNDDGTATIKVKVNPVDAEGVLVGIENVMISGYNAKESYVEYAAKYTYDAATGELVVTIPTEVMTTLLADDNAYLAQAGHYIMIDIYFANEFNEVPVSQVYTVEFAPEWYQDAE